LPFPGTIYRVAHGGSHSQTPSLLKQYVFSRELIRKPHLLVRNLVRLRLVDTAVKREFFGDAAS
jgi:hypothetical protein